MLLPLQARSSRQQQHIPLVKAQQPQQLGSKPIPDFLRVPPDEQEQRLAAMKSQLLSALQPTPDTVSAVAQDSKLMSGRTIWPWNAQHPAGLGHFTSWACTLS